MENSNDQLIPFLRELADSIESNKLEEEKLKHVGEFFISYKLHNTPTISYSDTDLIRFITMGWYIYNHMNKETDKDTDTDKDADTDTDTEID